MRPQALCRRLLAGYSDETTAKIAIGIGVLWTAISLAACSDAEVVDGSDDPPNSTSSVVVTEESLVLMYRSVITAVCEATSPPTLDCEGPMRVSEQFSGDATTTTETLPPVVVEAVHAQLPDVTFVDPEESFETPFIVLGPVDRPLPDVVAIEAGQICGDLCGQGTIYYFQYDGEGWDAATADDLGLPTEVWMS